MSEAGGEGDRKRRRADETSVCSCAANNEQSHHTREKDMFYITFNSYGSIQLSKVALQNFPSSLISQTFLGDDAVNEENKLFVPISCGLRSFPALIEEIYDGGFASKIPEQGLEFDLFVKWLRYLGLATSGRSLSTESQAAKRVSYFVEVFINSLELNDDSKAIVDGQSSRLVHNRVVCANMQPDIARYRHNLLPFEFARRGIHMTLKEICISLDKEREDFEAWNLSTLRLGRAAEGGFVQEGFRLPAPQSHSVTPPGTVLFALQCDITGGDNLFTYKGCRYNLVISGGLRGNGGTATLYRVGAGCSFAVGDVAEDLLVLSRLHAAEHPELLVEGGGVYDSDEHDISYISEDTGVVIDGVYTADSKDMPLTHGVITNFYKNEALGQSSHVLIVASKQQPILEFGCISYEGEVDPDDMWVFAIDQSPEWALCAEGAAP